MATMILILCMGVVAPFWPTGHLWVTNIIIKKYIYLAYLSTFSLYIPWSIVFLPHCHLGHTGLKTSHFSCPIMDNICAVSCEQKSQLQKSGHKGEKKTHDCIGPSECRMSRRYIPVRNMLNSEDYIYFFFYFSGTV